MCRILLIEDHAQYGPEIKHELEALGHEVDLFVGVNAIEGNTLYALSPENIRFGQIPFIDYTNPTAHCQAVQFDSYDIGLFDGAFVGINREGAEVVQAAAAANLVCVGISNGKFSNEDMLAAGAKFYQDKSKVVEDVGSVIAQALALCPQR